MLKHEVKKLVLDRAPTRYPKSIVTVLHRILELTFVPDWRKSDAEVCYSRPLTISKWAFHTNLEWHTVDRAIKILIRDGVIKVNPHAEGSYAVVPSALQLLESKFRNRSAKQLERKILTAVRMKFQRNPERVPTWNDPHPEPKIGDVGDYVLTCACVPPFCSHPSAV